MQTRPPARLHVILHQPEIAWNTGAIGRTCVAARARLWLIRPLGFHLDDRRVKRAGLDYWPDLDLAIVDRLEDAEQGVAPGRIWLYSTRATTPYTAARFLPGDALVFGPETRGLPRAWIEERADHALRIPIEPAARSLNLSSAVAIAVFEAVRQIDGPLQPQLG